MHGLFREPIGVEASHVADETDAPGEQERRDLNFVPSVALTRSVRWYVVGFAAFGAAAGFFAGASSSPIVASMLPLLFGLVGSAGGIYLATVDVESPVAVFRLRALGIAFAWFVALLLAGVGYGMAVRSPDGFAQFMLSRPDADELVRAGIVDSTRPPRETLALAWLDVHLRAVAAAPDIRLGALQAAAEALRREREAVGSALTRLDIEGLERLASTTERLGHALAQPAAPPASTTTTTTMDSAEPPAEGAAVAADGAAEVADAAEVAEVAPADDEDQDQDQDEGADSSAEQETLAVELDITLQEAFSRALLVFADEFRLLSRGAIADPAAARIAAEVLYEDLNSLVEPGEDYDRSLGILVSRTKSSQAERDYQELRVRVKAFCDLRASTARASASTLEWLESFRSTATDGAHAGETAAPAPGLPAYGTDDGGS